MTVTYQQLLRRELQQRTFRNAAYSLRSFAKALGLTPPHLSAVLNNKKGLSPASAEKIAAKLNWSQDEAHLFKTLVRAQHSRSARERASAEKKARELAHRDAFQTIELGQFQMIADWHHFAILHLLELDECQPNEIWISKKLSLEKAKVSESLALLEKLGFLERRENGWRPLKKFSATPNVPSSAIRNHHHQILKLAGDALESQAITHRDFSSVLMPIDRADLPKAKLALQKFRRRFCRDFSAGKKNALYCLSSQFFELTKSGET